MPQIFGMAQFTQPYTDDDDDAVFSTDDKTIETPSNNSNADEQSYVRGKPCSNILDILAPSLPRAVEKVGLMAFGSIFSLVITVITDFVQSLLQNIDTIPSEEVRYAWNILDSLYHSEYRNVLVPCFFRVMIVKAGLQARRMVHSRYVCADFRWFRYFHHMSALSFFPMVTANLASDMTWIPMRVYMFSLGFLNYKRRIPSR